MAHPNGISRDYTENGYVTALDLFSQDEIAAYRQCFDALEAREGKENCQIGLQARHFGEEFIWRMASDSRIIDLIASVMGEDILLLGTHFFCKYPDPDGEKFVAWHQDVTYWGLEPPEAHTAWIAIDDSDVENGCMQIIPGSHKDGIVTHATSDREGNLLSINQEIPDEYVDRSNAADIEL
ncbi:MAG: phytanoyl-CoA dioxygenase family protein, partial [Candidatus Latescibacterota bacterium]|nr:phytanoyl-CoA dioxygenase family protein [Candidatus Latescibacterota bacterium]